ncbi:uncharacterized protein SPPG_08782 [Spizellomyces punctatus DAOM BR117]|uniref:Uncharacterized protein n=1 Tax=Spizellomyces punctatus (strain DAOM BR117) TaxID=645134 RepID=A0A0L0H492_SPIPD|nr:uncharacterized protein SPPG_08782 [Spizellomyces punctatus DAOM BR117]KNC95789.1 hypothetical protein SPPG_08782 [Spizellomyces punctatus DAOM BR117]|eukprot:XP_016603829.1 hypothetical protein SPPG_08782 [Spizellomyces punctatus DAOM BR117]
MNPLTNRSQIFNQEAHDAFASLQRTFHDKFFDEVRDVDVPTPGYMALNDRVEDEGPESGRMKKSKSVQSLSSRPSTSNLSRRETEKERTFVPLRGSQSNLSRTMGSKSPFGSLSNLSASRSSKSLHGSQSLSRSTAKLAADSPPTRSGSPDLATILNNVEKSLEKSLAKAEDNLFQSTDNLVKVKLTALTGSSGHLYDPDALERSGSTTKLSRPASRLGLSSPTLHHYASQPSLAKVKSKSSLPEIDSRFVKPQSQQPILSRRESAHDMEAGEGRGVLVAAEEAIRAGEERRRRLRGSFEESISQPSLLESRPPLSRTHSTSINDITNRLADPTNFPSAYKSKYEATRLHQERVSEVGRASEVGAPGLSGNGSGAGLSKKAEQVVKRLTDPRNYTGTQKAKSTSLESLEQTGYPQGYTPPTQETKEKLRTKPKIEFFTDFAPSQPPSLRSSRTNLASDNEPRSLRSSRTNLADHGLRSSRTSLVETGVGSVRGSVTRRL